MIRDILIAPNPKLKTISQPVRQVGARERRLMDDMTETMYAADGIGLAAIQIGIPERIIVMDLREDEARKPLYFVNPEISGQSAKKAIYREGCLSVPDIFEEVERPAACRARFLDYDGSPQEIECSELLATCLQHEMDHLNGILFIDHLSRLKRDMALKKLRKAKKREESAPERPSLAL